MFTPSVFTLVVELGVSAIIVSLVPPRYVVAALLVFLPLQDLALSYVHGDVQLAVRYLPELIGVLLFVRVAATSVPTISRRTALLAMPLLLVVVYWFLTGVIASERFSTIAVGLRSEFRFLPLLAIPFFSHRIGADSLLYAYTIIGIAGLESVIGIAEFLGGASVKGVFSPSYTIIVDGVRYGEARPPSSDIVGTLGDRNLFGTFLVFAWAILLAVWQSKTEISRWTLSVVGAMLLVGIGLSSSREAVIAVITTIVAMAIIQRRKVQIIVACSIVAVLGLLTIWANFVERPPEKPTTEQSQVWTYPLTPNAWEPSGNFRMRLLETTARQISHKDRIFGFGIGAASDPRVIEDYTSPIYNELPYDREYIKHYLYDSNWATLLLEVGFGGCALFLATLGVFFASGLKLEHSWPGLGLALLVLVTFILGFFNAVLQHRPTSAILWLFAGIVLALGTRTSSDMSGQTYSRARDARYPGTRR